MALTLKKNVDFTKGNTFVNIIIFAIPIMLGELFQNLYHSTDSLVLGNYAGEVALAAVSVNGTLTNLIVGFFNGMSVGSTVVVSKAYGAGDQDRLKDSICYTYTFALIMGLALSVVGFIIAPYLVRIINASPDIYEQTLTYLRIFIAGVIFTIVYNNSAGILRGIGDMRTPFVILLISSTVNIVLDLLFCAVFGWGIAGVAFATIISQMVSVAISYYVIHHKLGFRCLDLSGVLSKGKKIVSEMVDVGVAAGFQGAIISFSNLFVWRYINRFSTATVAGVGVAQRVEKFVSLPNSAFGSAVTTYCGQNIGAGQREKIKEGIRAGIILAISFVVVIGCIILPNGRAISSVFNRNPDVLDTAVAMERVLIPLYFINSIRQVLMGALRADKRSKMTMVLTLTGMVGVRQLYLAIAMAIRPEIGTIFIGYPVGWGSAMVFSVIYYFICRRAMFDKNRK